MRDAIRMVGVVGAVVLCAASATPYQQKGLRGGVSHTPLGNGSFSITAEGNGYTKRSTLVEYCFRRAGEVCPTGFTVIDRDANTQQYGNFDKSDVALVVRCNGGSGNVAPAGHVQRGGSLFDGQ